MNLRTAFSALAVALMATLLASVPANAACALGPLQIQLAEFTVSQPPRRFYLGLEGQPTTFVIRFAGGCGNTAGVDYSTVPGSATSPSDYQHTSGPVSTFLPPEDAVDVPVAVPIEADGSAEPIVESFEVALSNPRVSDAVSLGLGLSRAPVLIVDADGAPRVGFERTAYAVSESDDVARIPVFRGGPIAGSTSVNYTISPDPAAPATPDQDFIAALTGILQFTETDRFKTIDLGVVNDRLGEGPENVIITLAAPSAGTTIENDRMTVTIGDNEESERPTSRFHHPRHTWRYNKSDYRIREFHVFTADNPGGSGVERVEMAIKRTRKSGACQWLGAGGWQARDCQNRLWLDMTYEPDALLWYYRMKQLKSSVGTRIKDYTAASRATDAAGNVERDFDERRNNNTFEIKRRRRR